MSAADAAARRLSIASDAVSHRLEGLRPVPALTALVALQLAQAAWFGFRTPHNGWIWYSGGDATSYWTEQWALGHLQIPQAVVGFGLPVFYAWVPLVTGPSLINGASVIVLFQLIVLVPLAVVLFWGVADRLFGRAFAWIAAATWVAGPLLLLHGFVPTYHWVFDQLFLAPHWFGFTNMADLPSLVAVLACALVTLRAVDTRSPNDAILAGLLGGLVLGLKPSNGFFLPAVAVLLVATRRFRELALWTAGAVPALLTLLIWKVRGLGYLPLTSNTYARLHEAAGAYPVGFATSKYLPFDLHHLGEELSNLREVFWSLRFLEFLVVAGAFGVIRRAPAKGLFVVVWFAGFGIVKASSVRSDFPSATYFRLAEPGLPAYILLALGTVFCLPRLGRRLRPSPADDPETRPVERLDPAKLVPAFAIAALAPLALVALARSPSTMRTAFDGNVVQEAPLTSALHLTASRNRDGNVTLSWRTPDVGGVKPGYVVYFTRDYADNGCRRPTRGALVCQLSTMQRLGVTQANSFVVSGATTLAQARWFRVALVADYQRWNANGDLMLVSGPVFIPPPRQSA
jgi:hypothetical protein